MTVVYLLLIGIVLFLLDYPTLKKNPSKLTGFVYFVLLLIGLGINYIVIEDLPIDSPAIFIEKIIMSLMER